MPPVAPRITSSLRARAARNTGAGGGDDSYNTVSLTLEATQALFNAVTRQEVTQAERQIDQQVYLLAATEQQLLIDVASAYFDILRAYEVLEARLAKSVPSDASWSRLVSSLRWA